MDYRVIKENDLFFMTDKDGDIPSDNSSGYGLYTRDTRFLSRLETRINGKKPLLLSSAADENYIAVIRLTNPHMEEDGEVILWRESVELLRKRFIYQGALYESMRLTNFSPQAARFAYSAQFDSDFMDMFVVRGFESGSLGQRVGTTVQPRQLTFAYEGADQVRRETRISWNLQEARVGEGGSVEFQLELGPGESEEIRFYIAPYIQGEGPDQHSPEEALQGLEQAYQTWNESTTAVRSDFKLFDALYHRGIQDLRVLLTDLGHGPFPVAGLPWYAVPFGRDSLIAALQMLIANPSMAKGTLLTMAACQGDSHDPWRDETPGKIMHEIRYGELANTHQVPFTPYYGTIDATPLFLVLAAEYYHWTRDAELLQRMMPNLERAIQWIEQYGDLDGDLFVEYDRTSSRGITNQGWKDSSDSIVHADGEYAQSPIALVEVQGYVYQAYTRLAPILSSLGQTELAAKLDQRARELQQRFEASFWMEKEQYYAIALDREKRQVQSVTSNPGHLLMSGIASPDRARAIAQRLTAPDLFSGYGIRTMSAASTGYNPMSYHDGSVWPHDNSLCLLGLSQGGFQREAVSVMEGLLRAAEKFEYNRLPELFCGYEDSIGYPVAYPVACSPQAWAAGTPLVFVQGLLGVQPNGLERTLTLRPMLLPQMNELHVANLRVGDGRLSLKLHRLSGDKVGVDMVSNTTGYEILIP